MKPVLLLALPVALLVALATRALGGDLPTGPGPLWPTAGARVVTVAPSPEAAALLGEVHGYAGWARFDEAKVPRRSHAHRGLWVTTFYNPVVAGEVAHPKLPLPDGSVLVKENRLSPDGGVAVLTVMAKRGGRWFWLEATPDGGVVQAKGAPVEGFGVGVCEGCHSQSDDNDEVYTHRFTE